MQVILFDIDGTLLLAGGAGQKAMYLAFSQQFQVLSPQEVPVHGCTDRGIAQALFQLHGVEDTSENWRRLRSAYLKQLAHQLPRHRGRVLPGVAQLLACLSARPTVAMGLLTGNVRRAAELKLSHFQLNHYFQFGAFGDDHLDRNDVAVEALAAWRRRRAAEGTADRTWVVGDTPLDIRCGRHIGARVVAVATGGYTASELAAENPDLLLDDLHDPSLLLGQLNGSR